MTEFDKDKFLSCCDRVVANYIEMGCELQKVEGLDNTVYEIKNAIGDVSIVKAMVKNNLEPSNGEV